MPIESNHILTRAFLFDQLNQIQCRLLQLQRAEGSRIVQSVLLNQAIQVLDQFVAGTSLHIFAWFNLLKHLHGFGRKFTFNQGHRRIRRRFQGETKLAGLHNFPRLQRTILKRRGDQLGREKSDAPQSHHAGDTQANPD